MRESKLDLILIKWRVRGMAAEIAGQVQRFVETTLPWR